MSKAFWQAKIWGLLHDPALKALRFPRDFGDEGPWICLERCMGGWISPKSKDQRSSSNLNGSWLDHINLSDLIASASDRASIGRIPYKHGAVQHTAQGLQIRHLLSGASWQLKNWVEEFNQDGQYTVVRRQELEDIPEVVWHEWDDPRKVFWWFWRCYPDVIAQQIPETHLLPADTRIPDVSLWSHCSTTSALAGALAGYYPKAEDYPRKGQSFKSSRPFLVTFTFTPIQEVIQASRKMRDFWAGSWVLHYLSAQVCWKIARKYGPDTLIYPCLYDQPLIDHWLLEEYPDFEQWLPSAKQARKPGVSQDRLLTAGFPNVLVLLLPDNGMALESGGPISAAMQFAEQTLREEWKKLGQRVLDKLKQREEDWKHIYPKLWDSWLGAQWQTYWSALPLGNYRDNLSQSPSQPDNFCEWADHQNNIANPNEPIFRKGDAEETFLKEIFSNYEFKFKQPNCNVGSWWSSLVDQLRNNLQGLKNGRTWQIPTAFGPRSTISGIGPVLRKPSTNSRSPDWATEGETHQFWSHHAGLFDGIEELNATEVLKRGLNQVLADILNLDQASSKISVLYPDLSSGVAGWLKQLNANQDQESNQKIRCYENACQNITEKFSWTVKDDESPGNLPWGIPWITRNRSHWFNPRLLNAGWLIDDFPGDENSRKNELERLKKTIAEYFDVGNNPTDWYVLASGDGDDMGQWLKGVHLKPYGDYIADQLTDKLDQMPESLENSLDGFLQVTKRMGPSTHAAFSRALLDFSNQLVPYLTEQRYAGRLIYCGGDDILAYLNLWEWDNWLRDILQCFKGQPDPCDEFQAGEEFGDYWRWKAGKAAAPDNHFNRPLFTMGGHEASISFGLVIAHHSVPLAIALENMEEAKEQAKEHKATDGSQKDALQVRVLYSNGNQLHATAKSQLLEPWQALISFQSTHPEVGFDPALFEQAAELIRQHPIPEKEAIAPWVRGFCSRRDIFKNTDTGHQAKDDFTTALIHLIECLWDTAPEKIQERELGNWLKLAAFTLRKRNIKPRKMNLHGGQA